MRTPVVLPKGEGKGQWWPLEVEPGQRTASLLCPKCGATITLEDHIIDRDGTVIPQVGCPVDCGFEEVVTLAGWNPEETP